MRILGIIPARGGSKGIKNKNIQILGNKPLIAHSIINAKSSKAITDLIVSTDSYKIAEISKSFGANIPFLRPSHLAEDNSSSFDVVCHALKEMESTHDYTYDATLLLQPTTPFRTTKLIDQSIEIFDPKIHDSLVSVINVGPSHPYRMYNLSNERLLSPYISSVSDPMMPRQSLPNIYLRSGDIYLTSRNCLTQKNNLIGDLSYGLEIDSKFAINIDEELDLILAETMLNNNLLPNI